MQEAAPYGDNLVANAMHKTRLHYHKRSLNLDSLDGSKFSGAHVKLHDSTGQCIPVTGSVVLPRPSHSSIAARS
jgi:hypothetical protein